MSKVDNKNKKLAKKEAKLAKKEAKAAKANAKYAAKAQKKHEKAYKSFVKDTEKKNAKLQAKAAKDGKAFVPLVIPPVDEFQTKKEIKAAAAAKKAYAKYVKKIEKKNAKSEKKCAKKGKPFVPLAVPDEEEFVNTASNENKAGKIILMIILLLLIWFLIYFIFQYINYEYVAPVVETTTASEQGEPAVYELYKNPHEITTTPDYSIADAKRLLQQTLHDNYKQCGFSKDPSGGAISFNNKIETINSADCFMFSVGGKSFAVSVKLSAVYYCHNGEYTPLSFNTTDILFD